MTLHDSLSDYLAMRRSLGYKLERQETLLHQFLAYLEGHDEELITTEHALAWATKPGAGQAWHSLRMQAVRGFARYLHASDPQVEVPAPWLLPAGPHRATPYLYTDEQIAGLIAAASTLRFPHLVATYATVIGLLAVTGMRRQEVTRLDRSDFDPREGVLVVRDTKFGKSRELPLQDSTVAALRRYLHRSDRPPSPPGTVALFVSMPGTRLSVTCLERGFRLLRDRAGIQPRAGRCRPRLHDLRHTFAVATLLDAYRSGEDVQARLALLCTYLGHVDPGDTYWYLEAAPELMGHAGQRLERYLHQGGQQ